MHKYQYWNSSFEIISAKFIFHQIYVVSWKLGWGGGTFLFEVDVKFIDALKK